MTGQYEILEHQADLKIRVFGKTKEELFLNSLLAMQDCMKPEIKESEERTKREIKIESPDLQALLVDFLSEVLYSIQTDKEIYSKVEFQKFSDTDLEGKLIGQKVERFCGDVKAVTYHDLAVEKIAGEWQATILFDI